MARQISSRRDPLMDYVRAALQALNAVDVHGASDDVVGVELDQIYVDVLVSFIPRDRNFVGYQDLCKQFPRTEVATKWDETREFISKAVLLGDPGGGKSTLSKKIYCELAKNSSWEKQNSRYLCNLERILRATEGV